MSQRNVFILIGALVVLGLLVVLGQSNRASDSAAGAAGAAFVPGLSTAINDIERVTIVKANGETVATLERRPETWVVLEKNAYHADVAKLRQTLNALGEAKTLEAKTATPELYSRLGVEDVSGADATGISLTFAAAGQELPTLILGNVEGTKFRYARRAGEAQSYLIDRNPDVPRSTALWLDTSIVDVRSDRVRAVTITHPDGQVLALAKASPDAPNFDVAGVPAGSELMYPGVANVIGNGLRELNLEDVEPAANPLEGMPTIVEFRTFDGLVLRAEGWKRGEDSWLAFTASVDAAQAAAAPATDGAAATDPATEAERINTRVGGWRYRVASFQYDQLTRRMADLLKPPG